MISLSNKYEVNWKVLTGLDIGTSQFTGGSEVDTDEFTLGKEDNTVFYKRYHNLYQFI